MTAPPDGWPPVPESLPHPVPDNHCHLDHRRYGSDDPPLALDEAIGLAAAVGVTRIVQIGCDLDSARWSVAAGRAHDELVVGVALHPNEAPRLAAAGSLDAAWAEIETLAADPVVRAVGETGLDFYRTAEDGREVQEESFRRHVDLAKRLDKTLVIHDRDAHADVLRVLDDETPPDRWVMHCFSGDATFARECLDRGGWLSFAGTVTFKAAHDLRAAAALTPPGRLLVETDAPYLTPTPYRGRGNASYLMPLTVRALAEVRGEDLETLCRGLDAATSEAYGGPWGG